MMNNFMRNQNQTYCNGNCEDCPETDKWVRMDEHGNECSIGLAELTDVLDFTDQNATVIEVDSKTIPALRLE